MADWIEIVVPLAGVLSGIVVLMVVFGRICFHIRWTEKYVRRYGQPNRFSEAICFCYPVVWVNVCPMTYPCCKRWVPIDRTQPQVAPGARYMTPHTGHVEANLPPPSYADLTPGDGNQEPVDPPQYDNLVREDEETLPSYEHVTEHVTQR